MSNTPNLDLERPDKGDTDWHTSLNSNFTKLDTGYGNNVASIADLPEVYIETGTFNSTSGDVISLPKSVGATNEYSVGVIATSRAGAIGDVWVTKTTSNFTVYCSEANTSDTFAAIIHYLGDVNSYGGSIYRRWYVSTDASITDHSDNTDTGSLAWILSQIGASPATVELPGNKSYAITANDVTINDNIQVIPQKGAIFTVGSGKTLTIEGHINAGPYEIFDGLGSFSIKNNIAYFEWFGAEGDYTTDDSSAVQSAYDSIEPNGVIQMLAKTYRIANQVLVNGSYLNFRTVGVGGTTFNEAGPPYQGSTFYCDASSTTFFLFDGNGAVEHSGPIFEHINFVGSSKVSTILLQLESVNRWTLRNVSFRGAEYGLSTLDTDGDASWGYISQPIVKDCDFGFDLNSSVSMFGGDIEPASGGKGIQIANDWSSSKIVGVKFDGASAATGVHIIGYRNIVSSCIFEGCDPAVYLDHDGAGHALSGDDNKVIGCTIFGSDGTETGITVEANANRSQLIGNYFGNCATNVNDLGSYTIRLDNEKFIYGAQNGILGMDSTGYYENYQVIKGTGSYPFFDLIDTDASGHQHRIRGYLNQIHFSDITAGNALIRIQDGECIYLGETTDPTATANVGLLYTRDNGSGKTQLCVRFGTGAIQVLATEP